MPHKEVRISAPGYYTVNSQFLMPEKHHVYYPTSGTWARTKQTAVHHRERLHTISVRQILHIALNNAKYFRVFTSARCLNTTLTGLLGFHTRWWCCMDRRQRKTKQSCGFSTIWRPCPWRYPRYSQHFIGGWSTEDYERRGERTERGGNTVAVLGQVTSTTRSLFTECMSEVLPQTKSCAKSGTGMLFWPQAPHNNESRPSLIIPTMIPPYISTGLTCSGPPTRDTHNLTRLTGEPSCSRLRSVNMSREYP